MTVKLLIKNVNLQHNNVSVSTAAVTAVDTADTVDTASLSEETPRSTLRLTDLADMDMADTDMADTAVDTVDTAVDTVDMVVDILTDTALTSDTDMAATDTNYLRSPNVYMENACTIWPACM